MKKVLMMLMIATTVVITGCGASWENSVKKNGGLISSKADYIVINTTGSRIMDVWKLQNTFVESEGESDGWSFIDQNGNAILLGGDVKVIRVNSQDIWDKYVEYHYDEIFMQDVMSNSEGTVSTQVE